MRTLVLAILLAAASRVHAQSTSSMFRGGPHHPGVSPASGVPQLGGLLWRFQTRGPVRSSPTIAGDELFVGSGDGHLYALDAWTGRERWRFAAGAGVSSSPAVTADAVFFGDLGGSIYAVARATGKERWRVRTGSLAPLPWGHEGTDYYASSPAVVGDRVFVGSGDGTVYALDAATGRERWTFKTGGRVRSSPAVVDGVVYIGSFDGHLYALDAATGRERWKYVTNGVSLVSANFGYDRRSIQSSPVVVGGVVYIGSRDGHLYALGARDGKLRWSYAHDATSWAISSPAVRDSVVYEGSSDGHFFHTLRVADGKEIWRVVTEKSVWASPVVAGGLVYIADGSYAAEGGGTVRALDVATGEERWRYRVNGGVLSSPALGDGILAFGSDDGAVYALGGSERALKRVVFWDSLVVQYAFGRSHQAVRDYLRDRGYDVMGVQALRAWMQSRVADRAPSVVVFALDYASSLLAGPAPDGRLMRRYLDGGGKIVWIGLPPRLWVPDSTGKRTLAGFGRGDVKELLGVEMDVDPFDAFGARVTEAGERWGLSGWFMSTWAVPAPPEVEVLAIDERGYAAAWARRYGGSPGTGFVHVGRPEWDDAALRQLLTVAEYRPRVRPAERSSR